MSKQAKKFGAFQGVFSPSILTILGVIMYLRLGWVTGVAGLWGVIIIILLAHVISITTGLSISSIATDKKIKAGGIYYILSRSLGSRLEKHPESKYFWQPRGGTSVYHSQSEAHCGCCQSRS